MHCTPRLWSRRRTPCADGDRDDRGLDDGCVARGRAVGRGLAHPLLLFDLFEQVGDPDVARPARDDAGLDRGTDVVGVDVAVPQPLAADDDDGVTDGTPRALEPADRLILRVQQVHHLVPQTGDVVAREVGGDCGRRRDDVRLGDRTAVGDLEQRVEPEREPAAARIDHARRREGREQIRGAQHGVARGNDRIVEHLYERGIAVAALDRLGRRPHHGEDRPFDGSQHRLVRGVGAAAQRAREVGALDPIEAVELVREAAQDLGRDHARVAARAHQRSAADRVAHLGHRLGRGQFAAHRLERERHVRARVAVGNRVHVQPVQLFLVGAQRVAKPQDRLTEVGSGEAGQRVHEPASSDRIGCGQ